MGDNRISSVALAGLLVLPAICCGPARAQSCAVREIGVNDSAAASLASTDCRLREAIPGARGDMYADPYRVTLSNGGVLTIELASTDLDAYLYVYSLAYTRLAYNDNASALSRDSKIVVGLDAGTYLLVATSRAVSTGAYTLRTSLASRASCPAAELRLDEEARGELAATDCRMLDAVAPSTDTSSADAYRVTLARRGVLRALMKSSSFSPYLELLDADSHGVTYYDADGDPEAEILVSLEPGTYTLLASSSVLEGAGAYTLKAALEDLRTCEVRAIGPDETVTGELLYDSDCGFLDLDVPSDDQTPVDVYRLTLPQAGVVTVDLASPDFDAYLFVLDSRGRLVGANDNSGGGTNSRVVASLAAETYYIWANSYGDEGRYALKTSFEQPRSCNPQDLAPGTAVQGTISETSCRVLDFVRPNNDRTAAAAYRLTLAERRLVTVDLTSLEFDTYLLLFDGSGKLLAVDDNSGGATDSRLTTLLDPGTYLIAASLGASGAGGFTLKASLADPPACAVEDLQPGASATGSLSEGDCRLREVVLGATGAAYAKRYRLTLDSGGALSLELSSPKFATGLVVTDPAGALVSLKLAGPSGTTLLKGTFRAGTYIVNVVSQLAARTGEYALKTAF